MAFLLTSHNIDLLSLTMIPLPNKFFIKPFEYTVLERTDHYAILTYGHKTLNYDVVKIIKQKEKTSVFKGKEVLFEAKERIPSSESWGKIAWTYTSLEDAKKKFQELNEKRLKESLTNSIHTKN